MADISNLFMTSPEDDILEYRERRKIDSMTLGESEYDTLLEEHFMSDDTSLDGMLDYSTDFRCHGWFCSLSLRFSFNFWTYCL